MGGPRRAARRHGDVLAVWRPWAARLTGRSLPTSHFVAEDEPEEVARQLAAVLAPDH